MNRIKIFESDDSKKLQTKVDKWTAKMKKEHPAGFKIFDVSLSASNAIGTDIYIAVVYKT